MPMNMSDTGTGYELIICQHLIMQLELIDTLKHNVLDWYVATEPIKNKNKSCVRLIFQAQDTRGDNI